MELFHYKEDRIPVLIFVAIFLLDICCYIWVSNIYLLFFYAILGIVIKAFICAWNHHHQHCETFTVPLLNRALEIIYGFQTGIVGYGWVLHHNLGHHVHYLDQTKDESAWKSPNGKLYSPLMYTFIVSVTAYYRAWKVGKKYPKIQGYFLAMCLIEFILLALLITYNPLGGILIFLVPMITGLVLTVYTTYHHHSGLETNDHLKASYNILQPWYNLITGNLGYHTAHHMKG
jgi:fatty acid desaturase